jgi:hypothetical protein
VLSGIFYLWTILAKSGGVPRQSLNARRSKSFPPTIRCRLFLSDQIRVYLRAEWLGVSDLRVATPARIVIADACTHAWTCTYNMVAGRDLGSGC